MVWRLGSWRGPLAKVREPLFMSREIQSLPFAKRGDVKAKPGGDLSIKSLSRYKNIGLDVVAGDIAEIWIWRKSITSAIRDIERSAKGSDPVGWEILIKWNLKMHQETGASGRRKIVASIWQIASISFKIADTEPTDGAWNLF